MLDNCSHNRSWRWLTTAWWLRVENGVLHHVVNKKVCKRRNNEGRKALVSEYQRIKPKTLSKIT